MPRWLGDPPNRQVVRDGTRAARSDRPYRTTSGDFPPDICTGISLKKKERGVPFKLIPVYVPQPSTGRGSTANGSSKPKYFFLLIVGQRSSVASRKILRLQFVVHIARQIDVRETARLQGSA